MTELKEDISDLQDLGSLGLLPEERERERLEGDKENPNLPPPGQVTMSLGRSVWT